jgi:hypothetical protein
MSSADALREKAGQDDLAVLWKHRVMPLPPDMPTNRFPIEAMYHGSRIARKGFTTCSPLSSCPAQPSDGAALAQGDLASRSAYSADAAVHGRAGDLGNVGTESLCPSHFSQVNNILTVFTTLHRSTPSAALGTILGGKLDRLTKAFRGYRA